jgi:hypothetical protein
MWTSRKEGKNSHNLLFPNSELFKNLIEVKRRDHPKAGPSLRIIIVCIKY